VDEIIIRQAGLADLDDLVRLRRLMFESMGAGDAAELDAADDAVRAYMCSAIPAETFYGWLAVTRQGQAVGSGGIVIDIHPPGPGNLSGRVGYIMNVVTVPAYRRHGIARRMMQTMLHWLAEQGIQRVSLHASQMGRPLYESMGFVAGNEMRFTIQHTPPPSASS
jgi:GNAT superfamily N-acetyltransferase